MKRSYGIAMVVLACVTACERGGAASSGAPASAASPVEGVWRIAEVTVTGANPSTTVDPPSVIIFAKTHYSMMRVNGGAERALFKAVVPESEEKIAAYDSFIANTGTYELNGMTLTVRPTVAKHPNYMSGGYDTYEIRTSGDTLWLAGRDVNIRFRMGDSLVADSNPVNETTLKLVRVE